MASSNSYLSVSLLYHSFVNFSIVLVIPKHSLRNYYVRQQSKVCCPHVLFSPCDLTVICRYDQILFCCPRRVLPHSAPLRRQRSRSLAYPYSARHWVLQIACISPQALLLCAVNDLVLSLIHIQLGIEFCKSLAFLLKLCSSAPSTISFFRLSIFSSALSSASRLYFSSSSASLRRQRARSLAYPYSARHWVLQVACISPQALLLLQRV